MATFMLSVLACNYTNMHYTNKNYSEPDFIIISNSNDSLFVSPATKYFYTYKVEPDQWIIDPENILANLYYHSIKVLEAWYFPGGGNISSDGKAIGKVMLRPFLVVGVAEGNTNIWRYHFEPVTGSFTPPYSDRRISHYVFKGIKK